MAALQRLALRGTPKATKAAARYTPAGGAERCGMCRHYVAPSSCARIEGPVSAAGWCMLFSRQVTYPHHAGVQSFVGGAAPSLDLSFMTPGTLPPGVTYTHASTATYFDVTGTLQTAAINTPRWDYDPVTHALRGLLLEEGKTNLLLNSATLTTQSVTVTAQVYTLSFYGTGTVTLSGVSSGSLVGVGAFPQRASLSFTPTAGTLTCTVTGTVQSAQLEAGQFGTSYIPTTGATVTRNADLCSVTPTPWFVAQSSTLAAEYMVPYAVLTTALGYISAELNDGTLNNTLSLRNAPNAGLSVAEARVFIANAQAGGAIAGSLVANTVLKLAATFGNLAGNTVLNAGAAVPFTFTANPATISKLSIGSGHTTPLDGWIRRIRYWPRLLPNAELQAVTT